MSSLKIQKLDPIEHILKRPDMYVGSIRPKISEEYICDFSADNEIQIKKKTITFPPALLRIFVEALSNAIDNAQRSKEAGIEASKIRVSINKETGETSVWNDGQIIPILKDESDNTTYKHSLIFGELRTSTNFNDEEERTVSGRNGLGIKLTNVFSTFFQVKGVDSVQKLSFQQQWKNNMRYVSEPKIGNSSLKNGFTEVSWIPDFKVFGMDGYTDEIINLYSRYVCDAAMLTKLNVYLNDEKLPVKSLQDYAKLYLSVDNPKRSPCKKRKEVDDEAEDEISKDLSKETKQQPKSGPKEMAYIKGKDSEVLLVPNTESNDFEAISFVNGVFTINGGRHVDGWCEAIFRPIVDHFNSPKKPQITIKDVKQFYRLFVVSTLINPEFSSQSKTELTSPDVQAHVEKKTINSILKWECTDKINDIIHSKELLVMKKSESKKKGYKAIEGYDPANEAGGKNSSECTLALCEGLSAKTFAVKGTDSMLFGKTGRDWFGIYPLRGKILNVRKSNPKAIAENKVITDIIQALNLRYGIDYTLDENFSQLNYGRLLILTDADTDGKHIAGLIMNFIHHLFPSLLQRSSPFLVEMMTPIAKFLIDKKEEKVFYDLYSADEFYKATLAEGRSVDVKYYKGLGTHSDDEIAEVFGKRVISYVKDDQADETLVKAFGDKRADERKEWMEKYDPSSEIALVDDTKFYKSISTFIDKEFITFSIDDCKRSIPNLMDGLKQSQRKILYACFLRNLKASMKVAQLAGFVAEKTNYHHGEQNLFETITKMANEFVGSNNIPLLYRDGQFGSRLQNGKDAANARYIFTRLENLTRLIFREEDDGLLDRIVDDGDIVEPKFYVPIIPMILVNGAEGIGSGWSCSIPAFNPIDLVVAVKEWMSALQDDDDAKSMDEEKISPWYRGFKGKIEKLGKNKYETFGICERNDTKANEAYVSEVPVGMSIQDFTDKLSQLKEEKKIKDFRNYSSANSASFIITETIDTMRCNVDNLKLSSNLNLNNMVMFDENFKIRKFDSIKEIIDSFCKVRMKFYALRKESILKDILQKLKILKNKKRFVEEVMDETLVIKRKKQATIERELEEAGYDQETTEKGYGYLLRMQVSSFTEEKIAELEAQILKRQQEHETLLATTERDLWLNDLEEFAKAYQTWFAEMEQADKKREKKRAKTDSKEAKKKRAKKE